MATEAKSQVWRWLSIELGIGAVALVAPGFFPPALQLVGRTASACALLAGLASLAAVHLGYAHGTNGLFAGIGAGFFARMILLAAGLVATRARGDVALAYAFTFFAIFAATQATEIAYVLSRTRTDKLARAA